MEVHYSSKKHTWETPQDFFDKLNIDVDTFKLSGITISRNKGELSELE